MTCRNLTPLELALASLFFTSIASAQIGPGALLVREGEDGFVDITEGGDFTGTERFGAGGIRHYNMCQGPGGMVLITEYGDYEGTTDDAVLGIDVNGPGVFASGVQGPVGLACSLTKVLVSEFESGEVTDITAGGDVAAVAPFATGLADPQDLLIDSEGTIWVTAVVAGGGSDLELYDITAGGDFADAEPHASGALNFGPMTEGPGGELLIGRGSEVVDFTEGGAAASLPVFATLPGTVMAVRHFEGFKTLAATPQGVFDITAGGDFTDATPFASGISFDLSTDILYVNGCGDEVVWVEGGESCDDGNLISGDGCSSSCEEEIDEPMSGGAGGASGGAGGMSGGTGGASAGAGGMTGGAGGATSGGTGGMNGRPGGEGGMGGAAGNGGAAGMSTPSGSGGMSAAMTSESDEGGCSVATRTEATSLAPLVLAILSLVARRKPKKK